MVHWQIGDVRISKYVEKEFTGNVYRFLIPDATPESCKQIEWLTPHFMNENDELAFVNSGICNRDSKLPDHRRYVLRKR